MVFPFNHFKMAEPRAAKAASHIDVVLVEGLTVLKITKHCEDEGSNGDLVQGVLLGLIQDNRLEITNCFPFPASKPGEEEDEDEVSYQMEMMRRLRAVNIDHLHVGWYQSTYLGSYINRTLLDVQYNYQKSIEESVVLIYDPLRTSQGMLTLKAFRLSNEMMKIYKDSEFTPEKLAKQGLSFHNMFEEIPLVVKNSSLVNVLLSELKDEGATKQSEQFLSLSTGSYLEKNVRLLMEGVDELCQDANKYHNYQRNISRQQQQRDNYVQRRQGDNAARQSRGEAPLPDEDLNKIFKPLPVPSRLDNLILSQQVNNYCQHVTQFSTQSFGKLFLAQSLQEEKKS